MRIEAKPVDCTLLMNDSPQLPTPRRALFPSTNLFGTLNGRGKMIDVLENSNTEEKHRDGPYSPSSLVLAGV